MERQKEKRSKTKTLAHREEKTGKEKNKTSCTQQPVSRGGRVHVICIPLLKWAQAALIKSALLESFLPSLQAFCSLDRVMSPVNPRAGSAGPKVVSIPFLLSRCHFVRSESSVASAECTTPGSSPRMSIREPRSSLGTERRKPTLPCSKMRDKHRA